MDAQPVKKTKRNLPPGAGPGRPKGLKNKMTGELKDMIMTALGNAGGVNYLTRQADENPKAFLTLVGKVLPMQVTGENGNAITVVVRDYTGRKKEADAAD